MHAFVALINPAHHDWTGILETCRLYLEADMDRGATDADVTVYSDRYGEIVLFCSDTFGMCWIYN